MVSANPTSADDRLARGRARIRELAAEAEAKRNALTAALLAEIGRPPTALDRVAAEALAATAVRAEMLRRADQDDSEERRLLAQQMRTSGFRPPPAEPPKPAPDRQLQDYIASKRGVPA